ncbi:MAG: helix-turn-helix transcriptional regulator [Synergistaceae bacterium]|jgi:transcriptional regulator with XRE-family HTH domain|nr:helix-turn-helix transcriptional regulator [Synergistaceae bacterium]
MNVTGTEQSAIYKHIKEAREKLGISQVDLAEMAGVSRASIVNWETAKRIPSVEILKKLAEVLKTSLSFLVGESSDIAPPDSDKKTQEYGRGSVNPAVPMDLDVIYAALKSVRDGALCTKPNDRAKAAQILKWALEELESAETESHDMENQDSIK